MENFLQFGRVFEEIISDLKFSYKKFKNPPLKNFWLRPWSHILMGIIYERPLVDTTIFMSLLFPLVPLFYFYL